LHKREGKRAYRLEGRKGAGDYKAFLHRIKKVVCIMRNLDFTKIGGEYMIRFPRHKRVGWTGIAEVEGKTLFGRRGGRGKSPSSKRGKTRRNFFGRGIQRLGKDSLAVGSPSEWSAEARQRHAIYFLSGCKRGKNKGRFGLDPFD